MNNDIRRNTRPVNFLRIAALCAFLISCTTDAQDPLESQEPVARQAPAASKGRVAPPSILSCDRNQLTAWIGIVTVYRRESDYTTIEISTDSETVERTTLTHVADDDASARYLLWGEDFAATDWDLIEESPGVLVANIRATAWICEDGVTAPVIDWQPPRN